MEPDDEVERIASIPDRETRLREATTGVSAAQRTMTELARMRRALVQELHEEGWSFAQIAEAAGISRGRVHQVRHQGPAPEGAFFGSDALTIATPLKVEQRDERPVVAAEDVTASQRLGELAKSLGFDVTYEQIPLTGKIDLNRSGLVVICGPRISPDVAAVLATDPVIQFAKVQGVWTLKDNKTDTTYYSGTDKDEPTPTDAAYLGRLARPDGKGSLLVFTGVHPQGTLGVIHLLANDLADLYRETRDQSFSLAVGVTYDPTTHDPTNVERLTPLYLHDQEA